MSQTSMDIHVNRKSRCPNNISQKYSNVAKSFNHTYKFQNSSWTNEAHGRVE